MQAIGAHHGNATAGNRQQPFVASLWIGIVRIEHHMDQAAIVRRGEQIVLLRAFEFHQAEIRFLPVDAVS